MSQPSPLPASALCNACESECFDFASSADLEPLESVIGQDRAVEALRFGIQIRRRGFHIFAHGPAGTGKATTVRQFLMHEAMRRPVARDWCYVFNFELAHRPLALDMPAGSGAALKRAMAQVVEELLINLPKTMENESNAGRRKELLAGFEVRSRANYTETQSKAEARGLTLVPGPNGIGLAPRGAEGEPAMSHEAFAALPEAEQTRLHEAMAEAQTDLDDAARVERQIQREANEALAGFDREIATTEVACRLDDLREAFADLPAVQRYLDAVQRDVLDHLDFFEPLDDESEAIDGSQLSDEIAAARARRRGDQRLRRYGVNVLVDSSTDTGAPVVVERYPTLANLVGRMDHEQRMGALVTDFLLIKPGALHRANGGFLVIEVDELGKQPFSWDALKRALRHEEVRLEVPGSEQSTQTTITLDPEPIPLDTKVVLIGTTQMFFGLHDADADVPELFKVGAEFAASMPRDRETEQLYARFIGTVARRESMLPFDAGAVARVVQHSSRLSGDSTRLSAYFMDVTDLLRESDYWAREAGAAMVTRPHVTRAIDARTHRNDLARQRMLESFESELILLDVSGAKVGQVNGLTVLTRGDFSFGMPSRVTARVRPGKGDVVTIEREVDLSGPFHSKGVLILQGVLSGRYLADDELAVAASLTFEQSYSMVDGDSASSTELYALLSALADLPIRQSLAVTGSINQAGEVQAIGGVNEKIEGYFDVCRQRGLTGEQGVLIPRSNVRHLMLRRDVVEAVKDGQFQVYPIANVDEGITLLTGVEAGERNAGGDFPKGSVNARVQARLKSMAEQWRESRRLRDREPVS